MKEYDAHTRQGGWGTARKRPGVQLAGPWHQCAIEGDPYWIWSWYNGKAVGVVESKHVARAASRKGGKKNHQKFGRKGSCVLVHGIAGNFRLKYK